MAIECGYCEDKVNHIINYCGISICIDCNARMHRWGKYDPREDITDAERQKRIAWMHRETFLDGEEYDKYIAENTNDEI